MSSAPTAPSYIVIDPDQYRKDHPLNLDYNQNEGHPDPDPARNRTENAFTQAGYEWLGPGTDVYWNIQNNVKPVNDLDALGMEHDIAYTSIKEAYQYGELTYGQALEAIHRADVRLEMAANRLPYDVAPYWDPSVTGGPGTSVGHAMSLKEAYDDYFGVPTWSGITRDEFNTKTRPGVVTPDDPYAGGDYGHGPGTVGPGPQPGQGWQGGSGSGSDPWQHAHPWEGGGSWYNYAPSAPIRYTEDRNRNGIPDVLEKKKKRRRRHKQFSLYK